MPSNIESIVPTIAPTIFDSPLTCIQNADCESNYCNLKFGICQGIHSNGDSCSKNSDCLSGYCNTLTLKCISPNFDTACTSNTYCGQYYSVPFCNTFSYPYTCSHGATDGGDRQCGAGTQCMSGFCNKVTGSCTTGEDGSPCTA